MRLRALGRSVEFLVNRMRLFLRFSRGDDRAKLMKIFQAALTARLGPFVAFIDHLVGDIPMGSRSCVTPCCCLISWAILRSSLRRICIPPIRSKSVAVVQHRLNHLQAMVRLRLGDPDQPSAAAVDGRHISFDLVARSNKAPRIFSPPPFLAASTKPFCASLKSDRLISFLISLSVVCRSISVSASTAVGSKILPREKITARSVSRPFPNCVLSAGTRCRRGASTATPDSDRSAADSPGLCQILCLRGDLHSSANEPDRPSPHDGFMASASKSLQASL